MKNTHKLKLTTHDAFKKELLRDPKFRKINNEMAFEFSIYSALIRARIEKKLTQKQLAGRIGVAQSALARFESGRINSSVSFLSKVMRGLNLKLTVERNGK